MHLSHKSKVVPMHRGWGLYDDINSVIKQKGHNEQTHHPLVRDLILIPHRQLPQERPLLRTQEAS